MGIGFHIFFRIDSEIVIGDGELITKFFIIIIVDSVDGFVTRFNFFYFGLRSRLFWMVNGI